MDEKELSQRYASEAKNCIIHHFKDGFAVILLNDAPSTT